MSLVDSIIVNTILGTDNNIWSERYNVWCQNFEDITTYDAFEAEIKFVCKYYKIYKVCSEGVLKVFDQLQIKEVDMKDYTILFYTSRENMFKIISLEIYIPSIKKSIFCLNNDESTVVLIPRENSSVQTSFVRNDMKRLERNKIDLERATKKRKPFGKNYKRRWVSLFPFAPS